MNGVKKLISVVIPVYNVKNYLGKTLECILEQTYTNWELILVDDGSTDGSLEIAREYCIKDERIRLYLRNRLPKGAPSCRNIGLEQANGDYLIYLDSDDIIAPYCFQQRVDFIEKNDCDFAIFPLVGFHKRLFDAEGMIFGYMPEGDAVSALLARTLPFVVVSNIYKRKRLIEKSLYWDTSFKSYQDSDYNLQAINSGLSYKYSNSIPDYFYRLSAQNSICKKLSTASNCLSQIQFLEKQTNLYQDNKRYNKALLICAAHIYQNILMAESNTEAVEKFLSGKLLHGKKLLQAKIKIIAKISSRIENIKILDIIQLFLTPIFFVRYKYCFSNWGHYCKKMYIEVSNIYRDRVEDSIKRKIEEKI